MANITETTSRNNLIGNGTTIKGDIDAQGDIRIDGKIIGTVTSAGKVVIGQQGAVEGTIKCKNADISGNVRGTINVEELTSMKATSHIEGELYTKQLYIEIGAFFTGKCDMSTKVAQTPTK